MMVTLGQQAWQGDGTASTRLERFKTSLNQFNQQLKADLKRQSLPLQQRGKQICQQLSQLDQLEQQLQHQLPQLSALDLIDSTKPGLKTLL